MKFLFAMAIRMALVHQLSFAISTGVSGAYTAISLSTWNELLSLNSYTNNYLYWNCCIDQSRHCTNGVTLLSIQENYYALSRARSTHETF